MENEKSLISLELWMACQMGLNREQIMSMPRGEVFQRYEEKKRQCKTVAQEVKMITSDPEMIMLRERLFSNE